MRRPVTDRSPALVLVLGLSLVAVAGCARDRAAPSVPATEPPAGCAPEWSRAPAVPDAIAVPDGGLLMHALGSGTQDYVCASSQSDASGASSRSDANGTSSRSDANGTSSRSDANGTSSRSDANGSSSRSDASVTYAWTLVGPDATLADCRGAVVGRHFATDAGAPEWQTNDGAFVVGKKHLPVFSPPGEGDAHGGGAVPWLLLTATETGGAGPLHETRFIQRVGTSGGVAAAGAAGVTLCDEQHVGAKVNVPYTADYYFFGP
jgi:uncharacterized protein DUF3455